MARSKGGSGRDTPKPPKSSKAPKPLARPVRRAGLKGGHPAKAPAGPAPNVKLTTDERAVLQEICDEGQSAFADMGARLLAFGRTVFRKVFENESTAALDVDKSENPLWLELKRLAGGPRLRLDLRTVSAAVRMAAWDQRLNDEAFKGLDWGRKRLLLPLRKEDGIREAAQHVVAMKLDHDATERYVRNLRKGTGDEPTSRMTPARAEKHVDAFTAKLTENRALPKLATAVGKLEPARKKVLREKVAKAMAALKALEDALEE